ncbi:hypothetical protein HQ535_00480 [bacterium]|nr:hypothetical protein [bacterium]
MSSSRASGCSITDDLTSKELAAIEERLVRHNMAETGGRFDDPGVAFNVIAANPDGVVVGGINVSTKLNVIFLEVFWVNDAFRDHGLG